MLQCFMNRLNNSGKATFAAMVTKEAGAILNCPISNNTVKSGSAEATELAVMLGKAIHDACCEFESLEEMEKTIRLAANAPYTSCLTCIKCPDPIKESNFDTRAISENGIITPDEPKCFHKDGDNALDTDKKCIRCGHTPTELLQGSGCPFDAHTEDENPE